MKIWFDISNSPHINMFAHLIRELERDHEVIITSRPLANTVELLDLHGFKHHVVGVHYGGKLGAKILGYPIRVSQLVTFLSKMKIDVAVSQSSFHSPVVARLLGVRCIYMNDNEHALGNVPSFVCATTILVPEFMDAANLRRQWARESKIRRYPGVKEGIYLWEMASLLENERKRRDRLRPSVYVRPEPWTAQYYKGQQNFMDQILLGLKDHAHVVVLPRGGEQGKHYVQLERSHGIRVLSSAMDLAQIAPVCDMFIGAGGTMTREMAVLGVPTISVYQDKLLDVDRYLLQVGAFVHRPELTAKEALDFLSTASMKAPNRELLEKGRTAYDKVKNVVLNG
jgi:predicted glycosyltransferase